MKPKLNLLRHNQENDIIMGCETFFFLVEYISC